MSVTDQAFIRAYEDASAVASARNPRAGDRTPSPATGHMSPPTPHSNFGNRAAIHDALPGEVSVLSTGVGFDIASPDAKSIEARPLRTPVKMPLSAYQDLQRQSMEAAASCPALEVDSVRWPSICEELLAGHADEFTALGEQILLDQSSGQKVLAISGVCRGEGRTTLAMCLAKVLSPKLRIALVDADFEKPDLATALGLEVGGGWEGEPERHASVWESAIESLADGLSIVPLGGAIGSEAAAIALHQLASTVETVKRSYDVVIIDAGPIESTSVPHWLLNQSSVPIDQVLLAHDVRQTHGSRLAEVCLQLADAGRRNVGIAEMFVAEPARH